MSKMPAPLHAPLLVAPMQRGVGAQPPQMFTSDAVPRGTPVVYASGSSEYRRHVVEEDAVKSEYSRASKRRIESSPLGKLYVDAIEVGGDYQEIPLSGAEKHAVIQRAMSLVGAAPPRPAAPPQAAAEETPVDDKMILLSRGGNDQYGRAAEGGEANELPREFFRNPLFEMPADVWRRAKYLKAVDEAYMTLMPEIEVLMRQREFVALDYYVERLQRGGLAVRRTEAVSLYGKRVLHMETTLFGKLSSEEVDAIELELSEQQQAQQIHVDELPSVVEDGLRFHLFLSPSQAPMFGDAQRFEELVV